jgi:hypothetical protein
MYSVLQSILKALSQLALLIITVADPSSAQEARTTDSPPNTPSQQEKKDSWKLFFDGKTLRGWRGAFVDSLPKKGWKVRDCMLTVKESSGGGASFGVILSPSAS